MAKFIVDLSDEHRAMLEAHRRRLGERSLSDAVRRLIEAAPEFTCAEQSSDWSKGEIVVSDSSGPIAFGYLKDGPDGLVRIGPAKPTPGSRLKKR